MSRLHFYFLIWFVQYWGPLLLSYCYRYSSLLRLAEGRLETLAASTKDANQLPPEAPATCLEDSPPTCLGDEVREQIGCVALEPAQSVSNVEKPEKLLGEKMNEQIESVILEAAHNACKPGCAEEKSLVEDCGVLQAKVGICQTSDSQY